MDNTLNKIGTKLAAMWGGEFIEYTIEHNNRCVLFFCIEHRELFYVPITFDELEGVYDLTF